MPAKTKTVPSAAILHTVDIGNYSTYAITNNFDDAPRYFRSMRARVTAGTRVLRADDLNPLVEWKGHKYHFGDKAHSYSRKQASAVENKISDVNVFICSVLATLRPLHDQTKYSVILRWALPNPDLEHSSGRTYGEVFKQALTGTFQFTRNGQDMEVTISPEDPQYEGYASLVAAREEGQVSAKGNIMLIDLGGNTANGLMIDSSNEIIEATSCEGRGGVALATEIAKNQLVADRIGDTPSLAVIMEGIASGTHCYHEEPAQHWNDVYEELLGEWYTSILSEMKRRFRAHIPNTKGIVLVGGCANLLAETLAGKPGIYIPEHPELANIESMIAQQLQVAA
ncbi:hypothetical protein [Pseudanabaena sp. FACHB-2040]|uniref:ParM/StbA family protein n=1 Tax=Pseudanabaena sp. FACHB-2040 TaxID=2692859 RepID=UPI0016866375|nr:hypothetical protein [Pseudanabaena sp. FACHB-2040]MBD2256282.1 hypothetical protein [Pseudanabaena sp. FACHB-2040]